MDNTYISILRGINVSGKNIVKMNALKAMYEDLGLKNVKTYLQSGNVVFQSPLNDNNELANMLSQQIKKQFEWDVLVIVKTHEEWNSLIKANPFLNDSEKDQQYFHATILSGIAAPLNLTEINDKKGKDEDFAISDQAVYLYCPNGYGRTKLHNGFWESKLKTGATTRNWKTMIALLSLIDKK